MRWRLLHGVAFVGAAACQGGTFFVCNDDADCGGEGNEGICQPTGACSFPDEQCPSGQRYGDGGPVSLAGECVAQDSGSGGPEGSTGASTGDAGSADLTGGGDCPADWWDCAWAHRQRIELARPITPQQTSVPVPVLLTAGRVDLELMQADGEDVRFVSASGALAPYELERWDPEGVSTIWINIDELGGSADHLWLYYGNAVAENAEEPAGVWPDPFVGVWHLEGEPLDSTGNANDATVEGTTEVVAGQLANGRDFISTSALLAVEPTPSLADVFVGGGTVSAWIRPQGWGSGGYGRIANKSSGDGEGWLFYINNSGRLVFSLEFEPGTSPNWETLDDAIVRHQWTHVAVTYDTQGRWLPRMFVNGVEQRLQQAPMPPEIDPVPTDLDVPLTLGNRPSTDRRFDGILDEIRVEKTTRTSGWLSVQHDAMRDDLLSFGSVESWGGVP